MNAAVAIFHRAVPCPVVGLGKPLAIDLYCGLGGWTEGLLAEGYDVIGFDLERHQYGKHRYPAQLVIQNVLTLHGSQFKDAALIVASPPCQEFSWMAMPWSRAKHVARALRGEDEFPANYRGSRTIEQLTALFNACFRIQREASEAAGRHIPLIVENVRGAQRWGGRARWNHGSFYLWGDVPALMPVAFRASKNPGFRFDGSGRSFQSESVDRHTKKDDGLKGIPHRPAGHWTNPSEHEGVKQHGSGDAWFDKELDERRKRATEMMKDAGLKVPGIELGDVGFNVAAAKRYGQMVEGVKIKRAADDRRNHIGTSRKFASAMIAKIPLALSRHIARSFYPQRESVFRLGIPDFVDG